MKCISCFFCIIIVFLLIFIIFKNKTIEKFTNIDVVTETPKQIGHGSCKSYSKNSIEQPLTGECYECPKGYIRTKELINSPMACIQEKSCGELYKNSFEYLSSGECWKCNKEKRNSIEFPDACNDGTCKEMYGKDTFFNTSYDKCYSCPGGSIKTEYPVGSGLECLKLNFDPNSVVKLLSSEELEIKGIYYKDSFSQTVYLGDQFLDSIYVGSRYTPSKLVGNRYKKGKYLGNKDKYGLKYKSYI